MTGTYILEIEGLHIEFQRHDGTVKALDGVDLRVMRGETFGLVGETGCGKSVTAECVMRLLPTPPARVTSGHVFFALPDDVRSRMEELRKAAGDGAGDEHRQELERLVSQWDLLQRSRRYMDEVRGNLLSMVFQDPTAALDPVLTIGEQVSEVMLAHQRPELASAVLQQLEAARGGPFRPVHLRFLRRMVERPDALSLRIASHVPFLHRYERLVREEAERRAEALLARVRVPGPRAALRAYPFELSGGMQQRVMIAMAIACRPWLLLADEPTTALDVTIQAQILQLLKDLQAELGTSVLLITHSLGVVAETCDRVGVMYAGTVVETAPVDALFREPFHPYTQGLLRSLSAVTDRKGRLETIPGTVPDLIDPPPGCRFHPRCPHAMEMCSHERPVEREIAPGHLVRCHLFQEGKDGR